MVAEFYMISCLKNVKIKRHFVELSFGLIKQIWFFFKNVFFCNQLILNIFRINEQFSFYGRVTMLRSLLMYNQFVCQEKIFKELVPLLLNLLNVIRLKVKCEVRCELKCIFWGKYSCPIPF